LSVSGRLFYDLATQISHYTYLPAIRQRSFAIGPKLPGTRVPAELALGLALTDWLS